MKQKFEKHYNKITESLELDLEEKWTYIHYTKGSKEKTACILKNEPKSLEDYLEDFFKENLVSEDISKEVKRFLKSETNDAGLQWKEFADFIFKTITYHLFWGIAIFLVVYGSYQLGINLDNRFHLYPLFTIIGLIVGIGVGGLAAYKMLFKKYNTSVNPTLKQTKTEQQKTEKKEEPPIINVTIDQVRAAIRRFAEQLPKGVYRSILVKDNNEIDFTLLTKILGGLPSQKFYMSKETYDLFPENEKLIAVEMDLVQKAVDQYVKEQKKFPVLPFDPERRINYYQLLQEHYLRIKPAIQFYLTDLDGMITHIKPTNKELG